MNEILEGWGGKYGNTQSGIRGSKPGAGRSCNVIRRGRIEASDSTFKYKKKGRGKLKRTVSHEIGDTGVRKKKKEAKRCILRRLLYMK